MKLAAFALLAPLALSLPHAPPAPEGKPLAVHLGGRFVVTGREMRFGWPGAYIEGRFRGGDVTAYLETGGDFLRVSIDGKPFQTLVTPGQAAVKVTGLRPGVHSIRVDKLTESQSGSSSFYGFYTRGAPLPPPTRKRRIEFIGDSHTVGYGNTSKKRECSQAEVHDTTDTTLAFGPVLARRLDADYRVIAYSGYGVVRNYDGHKPGENLPYLYPRAIPGEAGGRAAEWDPQVIVINLGTNDFSTPVHAGEAWADAAALHADYRARYIDFVTMLRAKHPRARIFLMGAENFYADVQAVAAATRATPIEVPALEMTGCHWHPSIRDNVVEADLLQKAIGPVG